MVLAASCCLALCPNNDELQVHAVCTTRITCRTGCCAVLVDTISYLHIVARNANACACNAPWALHLAEVHSAFQASNVSPGLKVWLLLFIDRLVICRGAYRAELLLLPVFRRKCSLDPMKVWIREHICVAEWVKQLEVPATIVITT